MYDRHTQIPRIAPAARRPFPNWARVLLAVVVLVLFLLLFPPGRHAGAAIVEPPPERDWRWLVAGVFPARAVDDVLDLIDCESGGDPHAHGDLHLPHRTDGLGSGGLGQINVGNIYRTPMAALSEWQTDDPTEALTVMFDPVVNVTMMHRLWLSSGEHFGLHWVNCSRKLGLA